MYHLDTKATPVEPCSILGKQQCSLFVLLGQGGDDSSGIIFPVISIFKKSENGDKDRDKWNENS